MLRSAFVLSVLFVLLVPASILFAEPAQPSHEQALDGWIALSDGEDLFGWQVRGDGGHWFVADGILAATGESGNWIETDATFADFELVVEWKVSKGGNSGIFFRVGGEGPPWVDGYEAQIDEDDPKNPTGSIYNIIKAESVDVPDEKWHETRVVADGDHIRVDVDGKKVVDASDESHEEGKIGLQFHHGGMRVEFRKVWLKPLGLESIFDGKDFTGWRKVGTNPSFKIEDGAIRLQGGPGYVESDGTYDDFIAQVMVRTAPNSNSGVFFRGPRIEGDEFRAWPQGYEAQVFNQPRDFTTGGIYSFQAARGVYSQDGEWFLMTIDAVGNRLVTWVNGRIAADWEDPENRFQDGILALQAHDPNSIIFYRKVEIQDL